MSPKQSDSTKMGSVRDKNVLPSKEQNLFKSVVRLYETKQLKKALKTADTILKKFPDHGETLAMKGLTLNALDKKTEATELVRRGLRMHMQSHVCWHVYGLLHRSKRDYREAAKAYLQALRFDKDNQQILRDLALLQVQIRDYEGLEGTRRRLLTVRTNQQNNWIGFALSCHLLGNYSTAVSVLDSYYDTMSQSDEQENRFEVSELLLYKNMILEESGQFSEALAHLDEISSRIVDRLAIIESRARLYGAQGSFKEAREQFERLININPDNHAYQYALHLCILLENSPSESDPDKTADAKKPAITFRTTADWCSSTLNRIRTLGEEKDLNRMLSACDILSATHMYSYTSLRIALDIVPSANHSQFLPRVDSYVRKFLRKGIPSLFSDLKALYSDASKTEALGSLFENYLASLEATNARYLPPLHVSPSKNDDFTTSDESNTSTSQSKSVILEPPCTLLWVLHYLAQHYDRIGYQQRALETIDRAIQHTPTAIECYIVKAKILKHLGDFQGAVESANEARTLDLADRYLNTKCCKHALRADRVSDAEAWVSLFTRDGDSGGAQALYDMQCIWFELGAAESYMRGGQLALAFKKLTSIERIFADMVEDQFDFHSYCLRKVTLRAYVTLLRFEDRIRGHPYFGRATRDLVKCLLRIFELSDDERRNLTGDHSDIKGYAQMTNAERKKALSKRKKQRLRQRQVQASSGHGKGAGSKYSSNNADGNTHDASGGAGGGFGGASGGGSGVGGGSGGGTSSTGGKGSGGSNSADVKSKGAGSVETDPNGVEQMKELLKDGLGTNGTIMKDAARLTSELQTHLVDEVPTQVLVFEVSIRRQKYLAALRSVRRAQRLDPNDGGTLRIAIRLAHEIKHISNSSATGTTGKTWPSFVEKVFTEKGDVLGGLSISEFVDAYVKRNAGHSVRLLESLRARLWMVRVGIIDSDSVKGKECVDKVCNEMCDIITRSKVEGCGVDSLSAPFCRDFLLDLKADRVPNEVSKRLGETLKQKFPKASCF